MHKLEKCDTTLPYYDQGQGTSVGYVPTDRLPLLSQPFPAGNGKDGAR